MTTLAPLDLSVLEDLDFDNEVWLLEIKGLHDWQELKPPSSVTRCHWDITEEKVTLTGHRVWHNDKAILDKDWPTHLYMIRGDGFDATFELRLGSEDSFVRRLP